MLHCFSFPEHLTRHSVAMVPWGTWGRAFPADHGENPTPVPSPGGTSGVLCPSAQQGWGAPGERPVEGDKIRDRSIPAMRRG